MLPMRIKFIAGMLAFAALAFPFAAVHAFDVQSGNNVIIEADETVGGNLYAAGSQIIVDGTVTGDLFCAGATVTVNGTVGGDVICAGSSITINGTVGGDVRSASSELAINGAVSRGLTAFGSAININNEGSVGGNTLAFGATLRGDGPLGGDVQFFGASLILNDRVDGDVAFYGQAQDVNGNAPAVTIRPEATIAGGLSYYRGVETSISDSATIIGSTTIMERSATATPDAAGWLARLSLGWLLWSILTAIVIGFILIGLFPRQTTLAVTGMTREPGITLAWGILALILVPAVIVILAVSVIGLPLALLLLLLFCIAGMLAKILAAVAFGMWLAQRFRWSIGLYAQVAIGIVIAYLLFAIPIIGWILWLLAFLWGFGGLIKHGTGMYRQIEKPHQVTS